jgi:hypothetical protein
MMNKNIIKYIHTLKLNILGCDIPVHLTNTDERARLIWMPLAYLFGKHLSFLCIGVLYSHQILHADCGTLLLKNTKMISNYGTIPYFH